MIKSNEHRPGLSVKQENWDLKYFYCITCFRITNEEWGVGGNSDFSFSHIHGYGREGWKWARRRIGS